MSLVCYVRHMVSAMSEYKTIPINILLTKYLFINPQFLNEYPYFKYNHDRTTYVFNIKRNPFYLIFQAYYPISILSINLCSHLHQKCIAYRKDRDFYEIIPTIEKLLHKSEDRTRVKIVELLMKIVKSNAAIPQWIDVINKRVSNFMANSRMSSNEYFMSQTFLWNY